MFIVIYRIKLPAYMAIFENRLGTMHRMLTFISIGWFRYLRINKRYLTLSENLEILRQRLFTWKRRWCNHRLISLLTSVIFTNSLFSQKKKICKIFTFVLSKHDINLTINPPKMRSDIFFCVRAYFVFRIFIRK